MRELANAQDNRQAEHAMAEERGPSYKCAQEESLPPLSELIAEYNAMVQERLRKQREQDYHFGNTLYEWSLRERGEA